MKIIIVGCGKVGTSLAEQLNHEGHEITILDMNPDTVRALANKLDVMGMVGNGASYSVQVEAGIESSDLLIAVTGSDELNLLCCIIAKKAGNCNTIARVRNPLYSKDINSMKDQLGLAMVINPEYASAKEIARVFKFPSALSIDTFAKGRIELLKYKIEPGSILHGLSLISISEKLGVNVLICAVERGDEVFIPNGAFTLQERDIISFVAAPKNSLEFFKKIGAVTTGAKNTMIVGGGQLSYYLASELISMGIKVKIIERDKDRCIMLSELLPQASIICGDGTDRNLLMEEGLLSAESFASLTNLDEENIMLSLFVKSQCDAKLITKINRITFDEVVDTLELGSILNPKHVTSENIIRYIRAKQNSIGSNVETLYKLIEDKVEALEFNISEKSAVTDIPLQDLRLKNNLLICCINRYGKIITPRGQDTLRVGDKVVIVTTATGFDDIQDILED